MFVQLNSCLIPAYFRFHCTIHSVCMFVTKFTQSACLSTVLVCMFVTKRQKLKYLLYETSSTMRLNSFLASQLAKALFRERQFASLWSKLRERLFSRYNELLMEPWVVVVQPGNQFKFFLRKTGEKNGKRFSLGPLKIQEEIVIKRNITKPTSGV